MFLVPTGNAAVAASSAQLVGEEVWFQMQQSGDWYDHMTILVGSAVRLLCGEAGLFVVSNEAFDPQSSAEYTLYRLEAPQLPTLLDYLRQATQPNSSRVMVSETLSPALVKQLKQAAEDGAGEMVGLAEMSRVERCSLLVSDHAGVVGVLHALRPMGTPSCFEGGEEAEGTLRLFMAQLATGLRSALKSQSLVKEQARLAAIFEHSTDGILTVDSALRIIDFNPAMEQLTGWRESEVLGRFYHHVLRPKDRLGNEVGLQGSPMLQAFAGESVVNREMVIAARDGQLFAVRVTASCVRSGRGEPINGILNVRDITREREQEEQRSTFISVISHELQTPIAIIKGYASTLARSDATTLSGGQGIDGGAALHSRLRAIEEEADRLNKLVGNLLYASRIQAGGLLMDVAPLDLANLVEAVVRRLQAKSPDYQITLELPPNLPTVMADRDRIEEVLQNLLDNAIKYSPRASFFRPADATLSGGQVMRRRLPASLLSEARRDSVIGEMAKRKESVVAGPHFIPAETQSSCESSVAGVNKSLDERPKSTLIVTCSTTGDEVIVSISDSGMGIPVREQEQIFNRFQRADDKVTQSTPGAGLGLYICRAIVEAHSGHIWVESALHQGSTFSFSLPRVEKAHLPMVVF